MFGRGKNKSCRGAQSVKNINDFCVCPQCNFTFPHEQGIPCRSVLCPDCKIYLVRGGASSENSTSNGNRKNKNSTLDKESHIILPKTNDFPKINTEICTGCGACINVCPMKAIVIVNGKAIIAEEKCRNCRVCQRTCPVEAIS